MPNHDIDVRSPSDRRAQEGASNSTSPAIARFHRRFGGYERGADGRLVFVRWPGGPRNTWLTDPTRSDFDDNLVAEDVE